ncbi:MAG: phosphotransferase [Chloroflexi bacterium]|nr:phosphotransferase [Chloroflexota bacterium]
MPFLPDNFIRTITDLFNERGVAWLENLPGLIADCERRWSLQVLPPFDLSYNYVAPAICADGTEVVLKLGVPDGALTDEMTALRLWDGRGIVQLLDCDPDQGIMLLERLQPGTPLVTVEDDEEATRIFAQVARQLRIPAPAVHNFDTPQTWAEGLRRLRKRFDGDTGPLPAKIVETAESLFAELLGSQADPVLLHGDLHHWNILSATRLPWLALDPKGIVGEPCYEVGAWLRNPVGHLFNQPNPSRLFARRVAILAEELGFDRQRILGWGVAQAVLSAWWSIEDHGHGWEEAMVCAELLTELL